MCHWTGASFLLVRGQGGQQDWRRGLWASTTTLHRGLHLDVNPALNRIHSSTDGDLSKLPAGKWIQRAAFLGAKLISRLPRIQGMNLIPRKFHLPSSQYSPSFSSLRERSCVSMAPVITLLKWNLKEETESETGSGNLFLISDVIRFEACRCIEFMIVPLKPKITIWILIMNDNFKTATSTI